MRGLAGLLLAALAGAALTAAAPATARADEKCANGAFVKTAAYCDYFKQFVKPGAATVDERLSSRIKPKTDADPPVRSLALVVGVSAYPNFSNEKDRTLPPAKYDVVHLTDFLKEQKFDEIIVLENEAATKDNIRYFLDEYLLNRVSSAYDKRSRVFVAFSGHGAPGSSPDSPGYFVLGSSTGHGTSEMYKLSDLAGSMNEIGKHSYHFVALMGSCYSGGVFPEATKGGDSYFFYPGKPGAHVLTSAKANEFAYGLGGEHGSIFFDELIEGVRSGLGDFDFANWKTSPTDPGKYELAGGGIVRLGALTSHMSANIMKLGVNPSTGEEFPQLLFGKIATLPESGGAFFFLGPPLKEAVVADASVRSLVAAGSLTGSAAPGRPDIKVFAAPDTYEFQGLDVSHHNGDIDWEAVGKSGMSFVYMKATEGAGYADPTTATNRSGAEKAGLKVGLYHVFRFCTSAEAQVAWIRKNIERDDRLLPIAIDVQWEDGPLISGDKACADPARAQASLHALVSALKEFYGKAPVIHGWPAGFAQLLGDRFPDNALWLHDYKNNPNVKDRVLTLGGPKPWSIWQYTFKGAIPGVKGDVDLNVFYGGKEDFARFAGTGFDAEASVRAKPVRPGGN